MFHSLLNSALHLYYYNHLDNKYKVFTTKGVPSIDKVSKQNVSRQIFAKGTNNLY